MKSLLAIAIAAMSLVAMTSCASKKQDDAAQTTPKSLVLFYSQTGATKAVAEQIAKSLNADIEEIQVKEPYGGTYEETIGRCLEEMQNNLTPEVEPIKADLSQYDRVFLGFPVWFGIYARPILGVLDKYDFEGKEVVPFCTFGSGGIEACTEGLRISLPKADVKDGYGVRNARIIAMPEEVDYFLISNGYIDGEVAELPAYSDQQPVTDAEVEIFDAACGDYQFPLGTPVTVGKRSTDKSVDYLYTVSSKDQQGAEVMSTIYVTVPTDSKPEFTKVVR